MKTLQTPNLTEFREIAASLADETTQEFPNLYFDYAGIIPAKIEESKYDSTPINTKVFARTGGDGVHYSILEISEKIQPIVMTVPMNAGISMNHSNIIIGENFFEFLSIGFYNGWFPIEQLCYNNKWAIDFYSKENLEQNYQKSADIQYVIKLRRHFGYVHTPLNNERLKALENKYFYYLQFNFNFANKYQKAPPIP